MGWVRSLAEVSSPFLAGGDAVHAGRGCGGRWAADVVLGFQPGVGAGQAAPAAPRGDVAGKTVRVITDRVTTMMSKKGTAAIDVQVSKGLAGDAGPLGLANHYCNRVAVAPDLLATDAEAYFPSHEEPFIQVRFNNR